MEPNRVQPLDYRTASVETSSDYVASVEGVAGTMLSLVGALTLIALYRGPDSGAACWCLLVAPLATVTGVIVSAVAMGRGSRDPLEMIGLGLGFVGMLAHVPLVLGMIRILRGGWCC